MNKLDLEETTRRFHNVYEQVAKEYGYKTREDTKELDFNSPNGMTMLKTVETITTPYLEEIERLNQEIRGLNNCIIEFHSEFCNKQAEINRLNNIINELEEDFERKIQSCTIEAETTTNDFYCRLHIATLKRWLNKIKELKGSDK